MSDEENNQVLTKRISVSVEGSKQKIEELEEQLAVAQAEAEEGKQFKEMLGEVANSEFSRQKEDFASQFSGEKKEKILAIENPDAFETLKDFEGVKKQPSKGVITYPQGNQRDNTDILHREFETKEEAIHEFFMETKNPKNPHRAELKKLRDQKSLEAFTTLPSGSHVELEKAKFGLRRNHNYKEYTEAIQNQNSEGER